MCVVNVGKSLVVNTYLFFIRRFIVEKSFEIIVNVGNFLVNIFNLLCIWEFLVVIMNVVDVGKFLCKD